MKPIISPWLIYGIDLLDKCRTTAIIVMICLIITGGISGIILLVETYDINDIDWKCFWKFVKPGVVGFCITLCLTLVIPEKETLYQMIVASQITPDNIQTVTQVAGDTAEDVADYVIDIITRVSEATSND